jgi:hypothetical protein
MQGFLIKKGKTLGGWKSKYYVIQKGFLYSSEYASHLILF